MKKLLAIILASYSSVVCAEGYMLPKSFTIKNMDLPPVEENIESVTEVKEEKAVTKTINDVSLTNLIKNYDYDYASTFKSTLNTLFQSDITLVAYDSNSGQIKARLKSGRELFILLLPSQDKLTHVRITPADGRYDLPMDIVNGIFKGIGRSLYSGV